MSDDLTPAEREEFEERAGIIQFLAKKPKAEAESAARKIHTSQQAKTRQKRS